MILTNDLSAIFDKSVAESTSTMSGHIEEWGKRVEREKSVANIEKTSITPIDLLKIAEIEKSASTTS